MSDSASPGAQMPIALYCKKEAHLPGHPTPESYPAQLCSKHPGTRMVVSLTKLLSSPAHSLCACTQCHVTYQSPDLPQQKRPPANRSKNHPHLMFPGIIFCALPLNTSNQYKNIHTVIHAACSNTTFNEAFALFLLYRKEKKPLVVSQVIKRHFMFAEIDSKNKYKAFC